MINADQRYSNVAISGLEHVDAPIVLTSDEIDAQLTETLDRLHTPPGLLESLAGITERRLWEEGVQPSDAAAMAAEKVIESSGVNPDDIGIIINTSVCRDYIEPSTASIVHGKLGLSRTCLNFDLGNACLGFLNGMAVVGAMIERGEITHGLVVDGEGSRFAIEQTIARLQQPTATAEMYREQFATLTLGSGGAAMIVSAGHATDSPHRFLGGLSRAATEHYGLCVGQPDEMRTDTRRLLMAGLDVAKETWQEAYTSFDLKDEDVDLYVIHQISQVHTQMVGDLLGLDHDKVPRIFPKFGNTGPASIPMVLSNQLEANAVNPGDRVILMGMGSGINASAYEIIW
ncbi:MAG: 3-oxoacyl-ACP synthase III [Acidimicrobiia bacterium]|nr:3-oxoacyl-ACP synthase III [Acidimicrobiia bacterium]